MKAYLKLACGAERNWESRAHFLGVAAKAMRHVLVDHARSGRSAKRGGEALAVTLDESMAVAGLRPAELIALMMPSVRWRTVIRGKPTSSSSDTSAG